METMQAKQVESATEKSKKFELYYKDEFFLMNSGPVEAKTRHVTCGQMTETQDGFEIQLSANMPEGSKILTKLVE